MDKLDSKNEKVIFIGPDQEGVRKDEVKRNGRLVMKFLFGSTSMILVALTILSMAIMNGDAFSRFLGGSLYNFDDFLNEAFGPQFSFLISYILAAIILVGPIHYYVGYNLTDMLIILFITFFLLATFIGRMFKNPSWAFIGGIAVMIGFNMMIYLAINMIEYFVNSTIGGSFPIGAIVRGMLTGTFNEPSFELLLFYSALENGSFIGLCSVLWSLILHGKKKQIDYGISLSCDTGKICEI